MVNDEKVLFHLEITMVNYKKILKHLFRNSVMQNS